MITALAIENLCKVYGNGLEALKGVSLEVEKGDFFALLGPNGAGKSTTIGIICSLLTKSSGKVTVFDADIDVDFPKAKKYIGVVPQESNFNEFEKAQNILVAQAGYYGLPAKLARERSAKYLKRLGLWEKRNETSRLLSGGMKRRLMIARAMIHEPRLLILDEPTAGVDIEMRRSLWDFLREINESGTTIILTTHYLEEAEALCRNIAIIDNGRILEHSSMRALLQQLHREVFILDCVGTLPETIHLDGFNARRVDAHTLEVEVEKGRQLNTLFAALNTAKIEVSSMRNRANRLEEMFVSLVEGAA
ncbi:MAG: ABC transporter ATP-binding protein [Halieaceae bacterium]|jgi:ABC-2 type transport system ATP-binding protein|nr:ABC transporter ATP-binding protein [Halieaceae bacterium]